MAKFIMDPTSPAGVPLWRCTQAERHEWIRQLRDVDPINVEALTSHPAWPRGFEIVPLDGFALDDGSSNHFRVQYRQTPSAAGVWLVVERCKSYVEAVEHGFIIACVTRAVIRRGRSA